MIRLTEQTDTGRQAVIRVEGRLDADTLSAFQTALAALARGRSITLDLRGLASLDVHGREALLAARRAGHRLAAGSLYIQQLLDEVEP